MLVWSGIVSLWGANAGADTMPPRQLSNALAAELGPDWRARVQRFDEEPLAAASIGQVPSCSLDRTPVFSTASSVCRHSRVHSLSHSRIWVREKLLGISLYLVRQVQSANFAQIGVSPKTWQRLTHGCGCHCAGT